MPLFVNGYCKEFAATEENTFVFQILYQILYRHKNQSCFLPSSVHESSEELTKFILKLITNSEESINTTVFPAEHFYIVLDKDDDAFPVNLVMKKTAQRLQFNY